jgi:hypothetical protein
VSVCGRCLAGAWQIPGLLCTSQMVFRKLLGSPSRPRVGPVTGPLHTPLNRLGGVVYAESRASGGVRAGGLLMDVVLPGGMMDGLQRPSFGQQHLCVRDRWAGGSQGGSAAARGKVLRNARLLRSWLKIHLWYPLRAHGCLPCMFQHSVWLY